MIQIFLKATFALSTALLVSCTATKSKNQNFLSSYQGFKQDSKLDNESSYRGDLSKLSDYDSVFLEEVKVFKPQDMEKKKITEDELLELKKAFRAALIEDLKESRYSLVSKASPKTLSLRAAVTEIYPGNPGLFAAGYLPYVGTAITATKLATGEKVGAGSATIEAELLDSVTRERFFAVIDENAGSKIDIASGLSRWGHVELAFRKWAETIREAIAESEP
ncbi:MAG: DUF3313 domain-containing protein [Akkermansiaceae bacterium]